MLNRSCYAVLVVLLVGTISSVSAATKKQADYMEPIRHANPKVKAPWKALADYPRPPAPDTGWGMHDHMSGTWVPQDPDAFFKELKGKYGFSWYKVLAVGENKLTMCEAARRQGVEPVVRLYRSHFMPEYPTPGKEEEELRQQIRNYVKAGAYYFELGNEPNLGGEWSDSWYKLEINDHMTQIEAMCEEWLRIKKIVQEEGGIPIFYANTPGTAGEWYNDSFMTFKKWGKIEEAFAGAAIAIHPYPLNHPLDYPFDNIRNMPHATKEEAFKSLLKDNTCFNILQFIMLLEDKYLPYQIPIIGTESGVGVGEGNDPKYPTTTEDIAVQRNMEIFNRMNPKAPGYWGDAFFSENVCAYGGDGVFMFIRWFNSPQFKGGNHPALAVMEKTTKFDRGVAFKKK